MGGCAFCCWSLRLGYLGITIFIQQNTPFCQLFQTASFEDSSGAMPELTASCCDSGTSHFHRGEAVRGLLPAPVPRQQLPGTAWCVSVCQHISTPTHGDTELCCFRSDILLILLFCNRLTPLGRLWTSFHVMIARSGSLPHHFRKIQSEE